MGLPVGVDPAAAAEASDPRLGPPEWREPPDGRVRRRVSWLVLPNLVLAAWYFGWLLRPTNVGHAGLFAALVTAELFNLAQACGFWWTCRSERWRAPAPPLRDVAVDVFIPVYDEPLEVVEPTIAAAAAMRADGVEVRVAVLDDGGRAELAAMAARHGVGYLARADNAGAKAGNINHALRRTSAPFVAVFDCDHVPSPAFLDRTLGHFADERVALVQTPQCYANTATNGVAAAAWAQQALFFGGIARGKDGLDAMFCCGTNMVLRRQALDEIGHFPQDSVTEDFVLSISLQERGWASAYVPEVLAQGLGPEDLGSYVSQQMRWARGCLGSIPRILRARLAPRIRLQYLLSSMFFLTGWTFLVYTSLPIIRIVSGAQPLAAASADQFAIRFLPYYAMCLVTVAVAGGGAYTFRAFALLATTAWVHVRATLAALLRLRARFVVTPKTGSSRVQPRAIALPLLVVVALVGASVHGLVREVSPSMLNNVAFASLHIVLLTTGIVVCSWPTRFLPATEAADPTSDPVSERNPTLDLRAAPGTAQRAPLPPTPSPEVSSRVHS